VTAASRAAAAPVPAPGQQHDLEDVVPGAFLVLGEQVEQGRSAPARHRRDPLPAAGHAHRAIARVIPGPETAKVAAAPNRATSAADWVGPKGSVVAEQEGPEGMPLGAPVCELLDGRVGRRQPGDQDDPGCDDVVVPSQRIAPPPPPPLPRFAALLVLATLRR